MALRLTGTSLLTQRPATPAELSARASAGLAAGDVAGYSELFAGATGIEDQFERYHARLMLVEQGLRAAGESAPARAAEVYLAVARTLVEILTEEPREPLLLNYAGVAFYELWSLDAARALFKAAGRLDPAIPHVRRNLREVEKRMRGGQGPAARLRPLHTTLPALARRAKALAARAQPAKDLTLSLCMIVKNEEEWLPRCLAAAAPAVDEIIVVDTGSSDRTIEIARSFGAKVIEREWTGSFAQARNVSLEAATGDWLMYLDADEVLVAEDVERLRALTGQVWREAFYLLETSYSGAEGEGTGVSHTALRVFRNRPHYRFEGRLHEQFAQHLPLGVPGRVEHTSIRLEHFGYLGSVRAAKDKSRRNIDLLLTQRAERPSGDALDAFLRFNLGTEYLAVDEASKAREEFERAWQIVRAHDYIAREWVPSLVIRLITSRHRCGLAQQAIALADEAAEFFPGFTDLVFAKGQALASLGRHEEAGTAWERCLEMGDAPARYGATVGCGAQLALLALAEQQAHRDPAGARGLLERCLDEHPSFYAAIAPYATALLSQGADGEAVVREVEQRIEHPGPTARFALASALHAHGSLVTAERQYREVLASRPDSAQVRVTLAEMLLRAGRYDEAGEVIALIGAEDPFGAIASRIKLWATIGAGQLDGLTAADEEAGRAGLSDAEREVFHRWGAVSAGEVAQDGLAIAGTPLLGVILETLLAMHDFTGFERLLPLLAGSELPRREQRELLAGMYLRYGFLQSAAREWMAVCEHEPDSRALLGLAQVAAGHGLLDDAATFAAQAVVLDPANEYARQLAGALAGSAARA